MNFDDDGTDGDDGVCVWRSVVPVEVSLGLLWGERSEVEVLLDRVRRRDDGAGDCFLVDAAMFGDRNAFYVY